MKAKNEEMPLPPAHRTDGIGEPEPDYDAPAAAPPSVEPEPEARTRNFGEVRIVKTGMEPSGGAEDPDHPQDYFALLPGVHDDQRAAEKWLKDNGEDATEYAIIRLVSRHRVSVKRVETRSLVAVP